MSLEELYEQQIKPLPKKERLLLLAMIAQDLASEVEEDPTVEFLSSLLKRQRSQGKRQRVQGGMPMSAFRPYILKALAQLGGRAREAEVLERVWEMVRPQLTEIDLEWLPTGNDYRWRKKARWERLKMKQEGLLRDDSPRGIWELSKKGWQEAMKLLEGEGAPEATGATTDEDPAVEKLRELLNRGKVTTGEENA